MADPLGQLPTMTIYAKETGSTRMLPVLVDGDYDGEWFSGMRWLLNKQGYVITSHFRDRRESNKYTYLHHMILPPKPGVWVTFKNRNRLDCRSANLAYMTPKENIAGRRPGFKRRNARPDGPFHSKYRGVRRASRPGAGGRETIAKTWVATSRGNFIGSYSTEEQAARAYDSVSRLLYNNRLKDDSLNFPDENNIFPVRRILESGIYERCVWCGNKIADLAVMRYSKGKDPCGICGRTLPPEYITLQERKR